MTDEVALAVQRNEQGLCAITDCPKPPTVEASYIEGVVTVGGRETHYRARLCDRHYRMVAPADDFMSAIHQLERS